MMSPALSAALAAASEALAAIGAALASPTDAAATVSKTAGGTSASLTDAAAAVSPTAGVSSDSPPAVAPLSNLNDADLVAYHRSLASIRREVDSRLAHASGEIAHRSRRELGRNGLAQREGFRTPEALIQNQTGSTAREAHTLVTTGAMVWDAFPPEPIDGRVAPEPIEPWLREVGCAVAAGAITLEGARSIRAGLGQPHVDENGHGITEEALAAAVAVVVEAASERNADQLFRLAKELRDELDESGVLDRERVIHERRGLWRYTKPDGSVRFTLDFDLESSAYANDVYDKITSPRRGGPRFVDETDTRWADLVAADTRSLPQYALDMFVGLLRLGVQASGDAARSIVGPRQPSVRLLAVAGSFRDGTGRAHLEGITTPVSIDTVERVACTEGSVVITFDSEGQPLNLGRESRLFSPAQRIALAARDGGCRWPHCDRPASWCEAHHIRFWDRDQGRTDIADGILLCQHHHMLAHNNHWEITRTGGDYLLLPPPGLDLSRTSIPLASKSAAWHDLRRRAAGASPDAATGAGLSEG